MAHVSMDLYKNSLLSTVIYKSNGYILEILQTMRWSRKTQMDFNVTEILSPDTPICRSVVWRRKAAGQLYDQERSFRIWLIRSSSDWRNERPMKLTKDKKEEIDMDDKLSLIIIFTILPDCIVMGLNIYESLLYQWQQKTHKI